MSRKPKPTPSDALYRQIGDAFWAYRRSVADYHEAAGGADSARAAGRIEDTYATLLGLLQGAGFPPGRLPAPQARHRRHGDWTGYGPWFSGVNDCRVEFEAWYEAREKDAPPSARLTFDDATLTVTLDGTSYPLGDPKAFLLYKAIATAEHPPLTNRQIRGRVRGLNATKAVPKRLKTLPEALQETISTNKSGHWLQLPPAKKGRVRP